MNKQISINLYGAVTKIPRGQYSFNWKQQLRLAFERVLSKAGLPHTTDYRNYVSPGTYNLGDHAIAIAIQQQIRKSQPCAAIAITDWENLNAVKLTTPVLIGGSGYFFIEGSKHPAKRIDVDTKFLKENKIPAAIFGVGVNHVTGGSLNLEDIPALGIATLAASLNQARAISVRDFNSKSILQQLTSTPIFVTGDPALYIKRSSGSPKEVPPSFLAQPMKIGINIPMHGPVPSNRFSRDFKKYANFLKRLQKDTQCIFIQTIHYNSEYVIGKMLQDQGILLIQGAGDVEALLALYQQMDFHIGGMLHSCILSASVGTPCIGLAYDIKHQGFFDLLGQPDLCVPAEPFDPQRLMEVCVKILNNKKMIRAQIETRRDQMELESDKFLSETLTVLTA